MFAALLGVSFNTGSEFIIAPRLQARTGAAGVTGEEGEPRYCHTLQDWGALGL
jgi:hypothetical protein